MSKAQKAEHITKAGIKRTAAFASTMYGIRLYAVGAKASKRAQFGTVKHDYGFVKSGTKQLYGKARANPTHTVTGVAILTAAGAGYGYYKYRQHRSGNITYSKRLHSGKVIKVTRKRGRNEMAKGRGSWSGGRAPAQGGTPHKMSKPEAPKGKLKGKMKKGTKSARKGGL